MKIFTQQRARVHKEKETYYEPDRMNKYINIESELVMRDFCFFSTRTAAIVCYYYILPHIT